MLKNLLFIRAKSFKTRIIKFILISLLLLGTFPSKASHIVGGEISVTWVSGSTFHIKINFYRDCKAGNAAFDLYETIGAYEIGTDDWAGCVDLYRTSITSLTLGDACYTPAGLCIERGVYEGDVTITNLPNGCYITTNVCCRNSTITNIFAPTSSGYTWYVEIPDPLLQNSSPTFDTYPSGYWCAGQTNVSDLSATDINGDSLVYSLVTPYDTYNSLQACPDYKPYPTITWNTPTYSSTSMIGTASSIFINPQTGILTVTPAYLGTFVICVRVEEYRRSDKKKLGEIRRDIQYTTLACNAQAAYPDTTICTGNSVPMNASGGTTYSWSPPTGLSNPNISNPVATPSVTTTYTVSITNGSNCTTTKTVTVQVTSVATAATSSPPAICSGQATSLSATGGGTYSWSPSTGLSNPSIANPTASPSVTTTYTVTVTNAGGCTSTATATVTVNSIPPLPTITKSTGGDTLYCSTNAAYASYQWYKNSFIISGATKSFLVITPTDTSSFTVVVTSAAGCTNTATYSNRILPIELVSFEAIFNGKTVDLKWATAKEINNDFFTVERTKDGADFTPIIYVKGAGNSNRFLNYHAADENPLFGVSAYRLRQTDFDGTYKFSRMVAISAKSNGKLEIVALNYNPSTGTFQYLIYAPAGREINIEVTDMIGKVVLRKLQAENIGTLDVSELGHGTYMFKAGSEGEYAIRKFIY